MPALRYRGIGLTGIGEGLVRDNEDVFTERLEQAVRDGGGVSRARNVMAMTFRDAADIVYDDIDIDGVAGLFLWDGYEMYVQNDVDMDGRALADANYDAFSKGTTASRSAKSKSTAKRTTAKKPAAKKTNGGRRWPRPRSPRPRRRTSSWTIPSSTRIATNAPGAGAHLGVGTSAYTSLGRRP